MVQTFSDEIHLSTLGLLQLTHTQKLEKWQPILIIGSEAELDFNQGMCTSYNFLLSKIWHQTVVMCRTNKTTITQGQWSFHSF